MMFQRARGLAGKVTIGVLSFPPRLASIGVTFLPQGCYRKDTGAGRRGVGFSGEKKRMVLKTFDLSELKTDLDT